MISVEWHYTILRFFHLELISRIYNNVLFVYDVSQTKTMPKFTPQWTVLIEYIVCVQRAYWAFDPAHKSLQYIFFDSLNLSFC